MDSPTSEIVELALRKDALQELVRRLERRLPLRLGFDGCRSRCLLLSLLALEHRELKPGEWDDERLLQGKRVCFADLICRREC